MADITAMSRRDRQKYRAIRRTLQAATDLLAEGGEDAVTIRSVAARAEVTERTVFRHIQSREKLLRALRQMLSEQYGPKRPPPTPLELIDEPRSRFPALAQERVMVRAYLQSQTRSDAPAPTIHEDRTEALIRCVQREIEYPFQDIPRRRAAIIELLSSPYALEFMQQFWGFDGEQAGEAAAEAIAILLGRRLAY